MSSEVSRGMAKGMTRGVLVFALRRRVGLEIRAQSGCVAE